MPDIVYVSTAGHGGFKLSAKLLRQFRRDMPALAAVGQGPWFEDDVEAAVIIATFPDMCPEDRRALFHTDAVRIVKDYYPDEWLAATCQLVPLEESRILRERAFLQSIVGKLLVRSAHGSNGVHGRSLIPAGYCGVVAVGAGDAMRSWDEYFLVPKALYDQHGEFGYVIDPYNMFADILPWPALESTQ